MRKHGYIKPGTKCLVCGRKKDLDKDGVVKYYIGKHNGDVYFANNKTDAVAKSGKISWVFSARGQVWSQYREIEYGITEVEPGKGTV